MKNTLLAAALLFTTFTALPANAANLSLKKGEQKSVKVNGRKVVCGFQRAKGKWVVVKKVGSKFSIVANPAAKEKAACGKFLSSKLAKSLTNLPGVSTLIRSKRLPSSNANIQDVSGEPPAMVDINDIGVGIFFRSGVVETLRDAPEPNSCGEFFIGANDGESAGYEGAATVEDIGYTFEPLLRSGSNICYARSLASQENLDSGVLTVDAGELPNGQIAGLFKEPSGENARLVKLKFTKNQEVQRSSFIQLTSAQENRNKAQHFGYSFWTCGTNSEGESVKVYEQGVVKLDGTYEVHRVGNDEYGTFDATTSGRLKIEDGELAFDPAVSRTAEVKYLSISEMNRFKASLAVGSDGELSEHFLNLYRGRLSKKFLVANVTGDNLQNAAVTEAAFKDQLVETDLSSRDFSSALEYRDSGYRSAPNNALLSKVADEPLTGSFYEEIGEVDFNSSEFDCNATPDIEVSVNLDLDGAQEIVASCSDEADQVNNFTRENDTLRAILDGYDDDCGS